MKRALAALCLGMAMILGISVNMSTAAAETAAIAKPVSPRSGSVGILASPKCSGTAGYGKIRYQVCFQYNCDSNSCNLWAYLGLINTATSARTVAWDMDSRLQTGALGHDDDGFATLAAGEQRTIFSDRSWDVQACGGHVQWTQYLVVKQGSADWSPQISAVDTLFCA
jgi:hypothetical protein